MRFKFTLKFNVLFNIQNIPLLYKKRKRKVSKQRLGQITNTLSDHANRLRGTLGHHGIHNPWSNLERERNKTS